MTSTDTTATPTDSERETAADVHLAWINDPHDSSLSAYIAQALADQRAKYEAVADELASEAEHSGPAKGAVYRIAADRIRKVAQQ